MKLQTNAVSEDIWPLSPRILIRESQLGCIVYGSYETLDGIREILSRKGWEARFIDSIIIHSRQRKSETDISGVSEL